MTWKDLLALARVRLHDKAAPYLWSDDELREFANSAIDEACWRARLLRTSDTTATVSGTAEYTLDYHVIRVMNATFTDTDTSQTTQVWPVSLVELWKMKAVSPTATGRPEFYSVGEAFNSIEVFPTPDSLGLGTINYTINRLPDAGEKLVALGSEPPIPEEYHRDLVHWIEREAYLVPDVDAYDKDASLQAEKRFEVRFGLRPTARGEIVGKNSVVGADMYPRTFGF